MKIIYRFNQVNNTSDENDDVKLKSKAYTVQGQQ